MIQVSEERVEQHFPTTVLVRTFQAVNDLNTALRWCNPHEGRVPVDRTAAEAPY